MTVRFSLFGQTRPAMMCGSQPVHLSVSGAYYPEDVGGSYRGLTMYQATTTTATMTTAPVTTTPAACLR